MRLATLTASRPQRPPERNGAPGAPELRVGSQLAVLCRTQRHAVRLCPALASPERDDRGIATHGNARSRASETVFLWTTRPSRRRSASSTRTFACVSHSWGHDLALGADGLAGDSHPNFSTSWACLASLRAGTPHHPVVVHNHGRRFRNGQWRWASNHFTQRRRFDTRQRFSRSDRIIQLRGEPVGGLFRAQAQRGKATRYELLRLRLGRSHC